LTVDINSSVDLFGAHLKTIPVKFGIIKGYFNCSYNQLTTLVGSPKEVNGGFYCSNNQLTSLIGLSKEVKGDFYCSNNQLTTLDGLSPNIIKKTIIRDWYNQLDPKIKEDYFNKNLDQYPNLIEIIKQDKTLIKYYNKLVRINKLKELTK
jgi:hypothetical protein